MNRSRPTCGLLGCDLPVSDSEEYCSLDHQRSDVQNRSDVYDGADSISVYYNPEMGSAVDIWAVGDVLFARLPNNEVHRGEEAYMIQKALIQADGIDRREVQL